MGVQTVIRNESNKLEILCSWAPNHQARPIVICCTKDKQTGMPLPVKKGNSVTSPGMSQRTPAVVRGAVESGEASGQSRILGIGGGGERGFPCTITHCLIGCYLSGAVVRPDSRRKGRAYM